MILRTPRLFQPLAPWKMSFPSRDKRRGVRKLARKNLSTNARWRAQWFYVQPRSHSGSSTLECASASTGGIKAILEHNERVVDRWRSPGLYPGKAESSDGVMPFMRFSQVNKPTLHRLLSHNSEINRQVWMGQRAGNLEHICAYFSRIVMLSWHKKWILTGN